MVANAQTNEPELNIVKPVGLPSKMVRIMAAVGTIEKGGTNSQQGYKFIQSDDVLAAIRSELVKQNVALFSRALEFDQTAGQTKSGGTNWHVVVKFEFTLVDADTGESRSDTWFGESIDTSDKSINKAATAALKYWLMKTFMISTGDDIDQDSPTFQQRTPRQQLNGNGQQERRIPPKSNEKASNSSAASDVGTGQPDTREWQASAVKVLKDKFDKPYLQFQCTDGKPTGRGRDLLRQAGYECEAWTVAGETYDLIPPALVTVQKNGQFWNVMSVKPVQSEVAF